MTPADFIEHLTSSKLAITGYTLMTGILFETSRVGIRAIIEMRKAVQLHGWMLKPPHQRGVIPDNCSAGIRHFLSEVLLPIRHRLQTTEILAAYLGLGWTFLTYAVALPQAATLMRDDPDALFTLFGIGAGTSFLGVVIMIIATWLTRRMEALEERIAALLAELPPDDPAPRAAGVSPYRNMRTTETREYDVSARGILPSPAKP